ncbi:MAG: hypothetical protein JNM31_04500 [Flavobacteriales bacterium]|nr:hypothetical protein [Flavobacteriales bacterium]
MDQHKPNPVTRGALSAEQLIQARQHSTPLPVQTAHSMELVATVNGVDYVNDSRATFLDATLRTMSDLDRPVVWIAGAVGAEAGSAHISEFLRERVVALVLFGKAGSGSIDALRPFTEHVYSAEELRTAVFLARELAREGEVVLFSPACPSSDGFANYEERGTEFRRAVKDL